MNRRILALALGAALLAGAAQAHSFVVGALDIGHPWSRPAAQGGNGAGFLSVTSRSKVGDRLVSVASPISARVEIHESMVMDGKAMMHPRPGGLPVPAGGKAEMKPGGWHLMFIGLKKPLAIGDRFPATLTFQKAGKVQVEFVVQAAPAALPGPEHKH
jgi:copper(I)-binding protein